MEMYAGEPTARAEERGPVPAALKRFIWDIQSMVELAESEREILTIGRDLMARLLARDDWLPAPFSVARPGAGRQFQIYADGPQRFCVVSTILAGGAALSIAQPAIWEIMGVVSGSIERRPGDGRRLQAGSVETLRSAGDACFRLSNALGDQAAIAVHVYGGEIGGLSRREPGTADAWALDYANGANAPPYDIYSVQTEIRD